MSQEIMNELKPFSTRVLYGVIIATLLFIGLVHGGRMYLINFFYGSDIILTMLAQDRAYLLLGMEVVIAIAVLLMISCWSIYNTLVLKSFYRQRQQQGKKRGVLEQYYKDILWIFQSVVILVFFLTIRKFHEEGMIESCIVLFFELFAFCVNVYFAYIFFKNRTFKVWLWALFVINMCMMPFVYIMSGMDNEFYLENKIWFQFAWVLLIAIFILASNRQLQNYYKGRVKLSSLS